MLPDALAERGAQGRRRRPLRDRPRGARAGGDRGRRRRPTTSPSPRRRRSATCSRRSATASRASARVVSIGPVTSADRPRRRPRGRTSRPSATTSTGWSRRCSPTPDAAPTAARLRGVTALPITFLSDYGTADEFAGVCRAVIARIAPGRAGDRPDATGSRATTSAMARRCWRNALGFAPPGVHLAVVDPGVGTTRRAVAVAAAERASGCFVGPDNGLLGPAVERFGGAAEAVDVSRVAGPAGTGLGDLPRARPVRAGRGPSRARHAARRARRADRSGVAGDDRPRRPRDRARTAARGRGRPRRPFGNAGADRDRRRRRRRRARARQAAAGRRPRGARTRPSTRSPSPTSTRGAWCCSSIRPRSLALAVNRGDAARRLDLTPGDRVAADRL